jgi:hypothetical protein
VADHSPVSGAVGRKPGVPNRGSAEVKVLAQKHGPAAIKEAVRLMLGARSETARLAAINTILDRAYGRATQAHEHGTSQTIILKVDAEDFAL